MIFTSITSPILQRQGHSSGSMYFFILINKTKYLKQSNSLPINVLFSDGQ